MNYWFSCPAPKCPHIIKLRALSDFEAEMNLILAEEAHVRAKHQNIPEYTNDRVRRMVKRGFQMEV